MIEARAHPAARLFDGAGRHDDAALVVEDGQAAAITPVDGTLAGGTLADGRKAG